MSFDIAIEKQIGRRTVQIEINSPQRLIALAGPSGAGKTTLLNCIAGLVRPDRGHIVVGGRVLFSSVEAVNRAPENRGCGYVFQDARLFPHNTVRQNLLYGSARANGAADINFDDTVSLLGIADILERKPANLSGGEEKRVAIGRALLSAPRFLLLDEPLASLDPDRGEIVLQAIERLRDTLATPIIHVSHDAAELARLGGPTFTLD